MFTPRSVQAATVALTSLSGMYRNRVVPLLVARVVMTLSFRLPIVFRSIMSLTVATSYRRFTGTFTSYSPV